MRMLLAILTLCTGAVPVGAQVRPPVEGGRAQSLGQPASVKGTANIAVAWAEGARAATALGVQRDLLNPMLSLLAVQGEVFAEGWGDGVDAGVRARLLSPFARVAIGADYRVADGGVDLLLSAFHPLRRGGVFGDGSVLRLDYVPGRGHFTLGIDKPIRRNSTMGGSRPVHDRVALPRGVRRTTPAVSAGIALQLDRARAAAERIRLSVLPLGPLQPGAGALALAHELRPLQETLNGSGHGAEADVLDYHEALDAAFSIAVAGPAPNSSAVTPLGRAVSAGAREILLARVLVPYNALLGQLKQHDSVRGLGDDARADFLRWLHVRADVHPDRRAAAMGVFDALVGIVEENRALSLAQWRDSRFVWLPLQYALRPDQHDTQAELDAIVELATGTRFTDGNFVSYVVNEQFQYQLSRTIREAREYHVLWTHDFRGFDASGNPDEMSYRHVLRSYLAALTQRVQEYDRTGRFPTYMIVLDQWFYEVNHGRLWMSLLEDPLNHSLQLPPGFESWRDTIATAQRALREAVAGSALLQAQAQLYGDAWLRDLVKVHVNITNPADPSFWSRRVIRLIPLPDNMMRDHRKVVFYDLSEEDPYAGEAMFTGAGIGEHYANLSWEDRSLLVNGPATLPLKGAVRELLISQGIPPARIPHALQPRPRAPDYGERVRAVSQRNQQPLRALQVHNAAGFGMKDVNVAKAVLYTLMPAGSVIKIPDSLWNSDFWGSAVLGCALRGVRVLVIAPAAGNAPADAFGSLGRSRELLTRLIEARSLLEHRIAASGGMLHVGLYASQLQVTDIPAKIRHVETAFDTYPWLGSLFDFPPSVFEGLTQMADWVEGMSMAPAAVPEFEYDPHPKLHLKANFFASREAWSLMSRSEWADASWVYMQFRIAQVQERSAAVTTFEKYPDPLPEAGRGMVQDWYEGLTDAERERVVFYTFMGSHNQNSRSMVIDAEVGFLIAHWPGIIPYIDLITIIGQTQWIEMPAQLDGLLPLDTGWKRRMAHWIRIAM
ncbi:MAG: hypothetical protein KFH98_03215 [Gemmatimonadetes bacterium]|nr:hypothetical protein [Gemmatimonadota bacterium]